MKRFVFLALLISTLLLVGCRSQQEVCDIQTVMLEESFFPGEVLSEPLVSPIPDAPPESADRIFYIKSGLSTDVVQQDIMNFQYIRKASTFFENR